MRLDSPVLLVLILRLFENGIGLFWFIINGDCLIRYTHGVWSWVDNNSHDM